MQYGIPYQGSKSRLAEWVISNLPDADVFVDLFAGGCAVTHCALLSGKYACVLANDLGDGPVTFKRAIEGDFSGYYNVPTREEFNESSDFVTKLLYSFGNNCRDYLWSKRLESVKVAASRMLSASSLHERRMCYSTFLRELGTYLSSEGLERLQGLEGLERLERLMISKQDYRNVPFDYDDFETWLDEVPHLVIVSEYTCPKNCVEIAAREKTCHFSSANNSKKTMEKLFVQKRFLDEYHERMNQLVV